jgi:hypothetical protein
VGGYGNYRAERRWATDANVEESLNLKLGDRLPRGVFAPSQLVDVIRMGFSDGFSAEKRIIYQLALDTIVENLTKARQRRSISWLGLLCRKTIRKPHPNYIHEL